MIFKFGKNESFQKIFCFYFYFFFAQNIYSGYTLEPPRRGGSNEYPQSMFWSTNKKHRLNPCKPQFIKVVFKGTFIARTCYRDDKDML